MLPLTKTIVQTFASDRRAQWFERKLETLFPKDPLDLADKTKECELAVKFRLQKGIWHLGQVRECQHLTGPVEQWNRYVPTQFFGMEGGAWFSGYPGQEKQISSTRIRDILAYVEDKEEMVKALSGVALGPDLLFEYMHMHKMKAVCTSRVRMDIEAQKAME